MERIPDHITGAMPDGIAQRPSGSAERAREVVRRMEQPKTLVRNPRFRNIPIEARKDRLLHVELLAGEYMSAEQVYDFLPAWGYELPLSTVYKYLAQVRLPKNYRRQVEKRSRRVHDGLAVHHLIRIARDAREAGLAVDQRLQIARKLSEVPVIPDAFFFLRNPKRFGFFLEEQIAPLPDTRWRDKLRAYLKRRLKTGDNIRVLFVVNDRGDMTRARGYARELLERHSEMKLYLFAEQLTLKGSRNVVTARVWKTAWGDDVSLVDWMGLPGGSPTVQC